MNETVHPVVVTPTANTVQPVAKIDPPKPPRKRTSEAYARNTGILFVDQLRTR